MVNVYLEVGTKRTFAGAIDWPGWSRSGRTEPEALAHLARYGRRYAAALAGTGIAFEPPSDATELAVRERVAGNATTEFGAPGVPPPADARPIDGPELDRLTRILDACWAAFDRTAAAAAGVTLRTGPRGGGRDLDKIVGHVIGAEEAYLNALGARTPAADEDVAARWDQLRAVELAALAARARGEVPANPSQSKKLWPPRYFVRRAAWHTLDHLWEIEDRAAPAE
jgi:hypothetical protein